MVNEQKRKTLLGVLLILSVWYMNVAIHELTGYDLTALAGLIGVWVAFRFVPRHQPRTATRAIRK